MSDVFRIDQDGIPWVGDTPRPDAINIRNEDNWLDLGRERVCHWNRGFRLQFPNGWTISIQWGWSNYVTGYYERDRPPQDTSIDAEIAAWDSENRWLNWQDVNEYNANCDVEGYQTVEQVQNLIEVVRTLPADLYEGHENGQVTLARRREEMVKTVELIKRGEWPEAAEEPAEPNAMDWFT